VQGTIAIDYVRRRRSHKVNNLNNSKTERVIRKSARYMEMQTAGLWRGHTGHLTAVAVSLVLKYPANELLIQSKMI